MIKSIQIKNFKSIVNASIELGTVNIFIGENGSGKSNILEAIAFGAAASADKVDYEFLGSRGVRLTNPEFMFSAFNNTREKRVVQIDFEVDENMFNKYSYALSISKGDKRKWINNRNENESKNAEKELESVIFEENDQIRNKKLNDLLGDNKKEIEILLKLRNSINSLENPLADLEKKKSFFRYIYSLFLKDQFSNPDISEFIVYTLEQSSLRKFEETNQIYPLGVKGEGLFQYLKEISLDSKRKKTLNEIKHNLSMLDWYEDLSIPKEQAANDLSLKIKDKYLANNLKYFDQHSTNEGFLLLLFYSTLFISESTPTFFAIDNIDTALNPKLCEQLIRNLVKLAKKHKKQVIFTTHNPAVLDGLSLKDDNQRLFVVRRNDEGHTKIKRIEYKAEREMKLSDIWTKGFIGGLPDNF